MKNTGSRGGDEVVQLYARDLVSSVTTFEQNLVGFERLHLESGETRTATFVVAAEQLSLINPAGQRVVEPGEFKFMAAASSTDLRQEKTIELVEEVRR